MWFRICPAASPRGGHLSNPASPFSCTLVANLLFPSLLRGAGHLVKWKMIIIFGCSAPSLGCCSKTWEFHRMDGHIWLLKSIHFGKLQRDTASHAVRVEALQGSIQPPKPEKYFLGTYYVLSSTRETKINKRLISCPCVTENGGWSRLGKWMTAQYLVIHVMLQGPAASAPPGSLLEMKHLRPRPRPNE